MIMMTNDMYEDTNTEQFAAVRPVGAPWPSAVAGRPAKAKKVRRWPWVLVALGVGFAIGSASHTTTTPALAAVVAPPAVSAPATPAAPAPVAPVATVAPAPPVVAPAPAAAPAGPMTTFGNGTYEIGVDIKAGKYRSPGVQSSIAPLCYFDQTDASGTIKDQGVANEGPSRVTLKSGLTFKSSGCEDWVLVG